MYKHHNTTSIGIRCWDDGHKVAKDFMLYH